MRAEFERRAVRALSGVPPYVWDGESVPIPVEEIASEVYCLKVCFKSPEEMRRAPGCPPLESDEQLSGLLLTDRGQIWVNAAEAETSRGRARFTICHELGHWIMHRAFHPEALFCRARVMSRGEEQDAPAPDDLDIEEEAHLFAAAMLMPMPLVQREYARFREAGDDFDSLCKRFGSSRKAMGRRLHQVI